MDANELLDYLESEGVGFRLVGAEIRAEGSGLCPICEACRRKRNKKYPDSMYSVAAERLGVPADEAQDLAFAADFDTFPLATERWQRAKGLRARLERMVRP